MSDADKPLCFVLMPFGRKKDPTGRPDIDFNRVYDEGVRPAIEDAGLMPVRADREKTGGIIHKPMFERLMLCEYAVADLTTANANVFYELGVRHTHGRPPRSRSSPCISRSPSTSICSVPCPTTWAPTTLSDPSRPPRCAGR